MTVVKLRRAIIANMVCSYFLDYTLRCGVRNSWGALGAEHYCSDTGWVWREWGQISRWLMQSRAEPRRAGGKWKERCHCCVSPYTRGQNVPRFPTRSKAWRSRKREVDPHKWTLTLSLLLRCGGVGWGRWGERSCQTHNNWICETLLAGWTLHLWATSNLQGRGQARLQGGPYSKAQSTFVKHRQYRTLTLCVCVWLCRIFGLFILILHLLSLCCLYL